MDHAAPALPPELPRFERMSALDATFLHAERPEAPLHVGAVAVFEGAPFFDDLGNFRLDEVRARVGERLHLLPRLRKRAMSVPFELGRPLWVDDAEFDIGNHVHLAVLPPPGDRDLLEALADRLNMTLLDRRHPLWDLCFVGGLEGGKVALIERVHHAMVDGVAGVDLAAVLLDLQPTPAPIDVPDWVAAPTPSGLRLAVAGIGEDLWQPVEAARRLAGTLGSPAKVRNHVEGALALAGTFLRPRGRNQDPSIVAPVGRHRRLRSVGRPVADLKAAGQPSGATVNHVVLSAVVGGVQALLASRGEPVPPELHVLVPVSVRSPEEHGALGNRVAGIVVALPARETDPAQRLRTVREHMDTVKRRHEADGTELGLEAMELLPSAILRLVSGAVHRQPFIELVVTNVPGPPCPLYFLGAEMLESVPVVPLGGNLTVGIAALSYNGTLTLGVHADADACPDVEVLVDGISSAFDELIGIAGGAPDHERPSKAPRTRGARSTASRRSAGDAGRSGRSRPAAT